MDTTPFPADGIGKAVAATAVALAAVALPSVTAPTTPNVSGCQIMLFNEGPDHCWIAVGTADVLATLPTTGAGVRTCTPLAAGAILVLSISPLVHTHISTICRSTKTATVTVNVGSGV